MHRPPSEGRAARAQRHHDELAFGPPSFCGVLHRGGTGVLMFTPARADAQRVSLAKTDGRLWQGRDQGIARRIELRVPCKQGCRFKFSVTPALGSDGGPASAKRAARPGRRRSCRRGRHQTDQVTISAGPQGGDASGLLRVTLIMGVIGDTDVEPDETIEIKVEDTSQSRVRVAIPHTPWRPGISSTTTTPTQGCRSAGPTLIATGGPTPCGTTQRRAKRRFGT